MNIDQPTRMQIDALLIQRESQFCRVHEVENTINEILGSDYPFPSPPPLSSLTKRRKPRTKKKEAKDKLKAFALPLLNESESAFRITYVQDGFQSTEDHLDATALNPLINRDAQSIRILRIETIDASQSIRRVLYKPSAPE